MTGRLELTEDHFVPADRAELSAAGWVVADIVRDIGEQHVDAGRWLCEGPIPDELARLKTVADRLQEAAWYVREAVAPIERRARLTAWREDAAIRSYRTAMPDRGVLGSAGCAR